MANADIESSGSEAQPDTSLEAHRKGHDPSGNRDLFELLATILMALAVIATAWAGFQSAKWSGVQTTSFSQAGGARTESVRFSTVAGQQYGRDLIAFNDWLDAIVEDVDSGKIPDYDDSADYEPTPGTLSGFYYVRFRDEFKPAVEAWLATNPFFVPGAPATPFDMAEYELEAEQEAERQLSTAEMRTSDAASANQTSDNYVISVVLFAGVLFFAAMASKLTSTRLRLAMLLLAIAVFLGTATYIFTLPIEV